MGGVGLINGRYLLSYENNILATNADLNFSRKIFTRIE
jgi:hypothetical protein